MKQFLALFLTVLMMTSAAVADFTFDIAELERTPDCMVYPEENSADIIVRPTNQPFIGELDVEYGELIAYLDFIEKVDEEVVLLRLVISTALDEMFSADTLTIAVGKKSYSFDVYPVTSEYDRTYYEDYVVCFGKEGLKFVKAIAQTKKDDPLEITLEGADSITGRVIIPGDTAAYMYDRFVDLGGKKQELEYFDEIWTMEVK